MKTSDFDYDLPLELIAQTPAEPRDSSRLLVVHRATGELEHRVFRDITEYLQPGDVLVRNDSRVVPARLLGERPGTGGRVAPIICSICLRYSKPRCSLMCAIMACCICWAIGLFWRSAMILGSCIAAMCTVMCA